MSLETEKQPAGNPLSAADAFAKGDKKEEKVGKTASKKYEEVHFVNK